MELGGFVRPIQGPWIVENGHPDFLRSFGTPFCDCWDVAFSCFLDFFTSSTYHRL